MTTIDHFLCTTMGVSPQTLALVNDCEARLADAFAQAEQRAAFNQYKVLHAMQTHRLSDVHFAATTGYGYNDLGRDVLEDIYASVFGAEAALVRPQLVSGTHALAVALFGNLRAGDVLLSPVGAPYETLKAVIGTRPTAGSLLEHGVTYRQVDLLADGGIDYEGIRRVFAENPRIKMATIQRSKGYAWRRALPVAEIGELIRFLKSLDPDILCMVDNCYGEFVEEQEPIEVGADLAVGSLIKNPGGGLAPVGGYVVGKEAFVEAAATRATAPGLGKAVGPGLGVIASLLQGFFLAPNVVCGCIKGAMLLSAVMEAAGFDVLPRAPEARADIVQVIALGSKEKVLRFCRGIQRAAPVDSFVTPEGGAMPGYGCPVVMAAGAFVQGASIELSADAPLTEPYAVYFQGGLTYHHAKLGVLFAYDAVFS